MNSFDIEKLKENFYKRNIEVFCFESFQEAIFRAKNIAAPQNAKRAGYKPPCTILNRCVDCCTEERVCHSLSIIEGQAEKGRIRLFLVNEQAGF